MKLFRRIFLLCLITGGFILFAGFGSVENNAADIDAGIWCHVNWAVLDGPYNEDIVTYESIAVSNHGGNVMLTCQFHDVPNPPESIEKASGFDCGTPFGLTYDSWALVTPGGEGMLKCMIKKN